jgi:hypothetical protein
MTKQQKGQIRMWCSQSPGKFYSKLSNYSNRGWCWGNMYRFDTPYIVCHSGNSRKDRWDSRRKMLRNFIRRWHKAKDRQRMYYTGNQIISTIAQNASRWRSRQTAVAVGAAIQINLTSSIHQNSPISADEAILVGAAIAVRQYLVTGRAVTYIDI